ncbi:MAG: hypothetical protein IJH38_04295 [Clostridia bacterium]|nr:hypothetical protein [Clostridia bacterium]
MKELQIPKSVVNGVITAGMLRGFMEMSLGCWIYGLTVQARQFRPGKLTKTVLLAVELAVYVGILVLYLFGKHHDKYDWDAVLLLGTAQLITQSELSYSAGFFRGKISGFLGRLSFPLYLGHRYWSMILKKIRPLGNSGYRVRLCIYIMLAMASAFAIMHGGELLRKGLSKLWHRAETEEPGEEQ